MRSRHVFSAPDVATARAAMAAARDAGLSDDCLSLVARADIEMDSLPDHSREAPTDFKPAAVRGAAAGGATGLLAGLAAVAFPPLGVTLAGAALMTVGGAALGTWVAALVGSTVEDPVRRKFEDEIGAGRVLVIADMDETTHPAVSAAITGSGATQLPFDAPTALS